MRKYRLKATDSTINIFVCLDIFTNIFAPLLLGHLLYDLKNSVALPNLIANHVHDGLWAYAFANTVLIIWQRKIHVVWLCLAFTTSMVFEMLQHLHQIGGTGDVYDVVTYFASFLIAIAVNHYFKYLTLLKPKKNAKF